jgi:hypothetical protein
MATAKEARQARSEIAAWNVLALKLFETSGNLTGAISHCTRHNLSPGPRLMELREEINVLRLECRDVLRFECAQKSS